MDYREEKESLLKSIAMTEQALGQSRAKNLTLQPKIDASRAAMDRCTELKKLSLDTLEYMKKGDLIEMKAFGEMMVHYKNNKELEVKYKNDLFLYQKMLKASKEETAHLEKVVGEATKRANATAIVVPFER